MILKAKGLAFWASLNYIHSSLVGFSFLLSVTGISYTGDLQAGSHHSVARKVTAKREQKQDKKHWSSVTYLKPHILCCIHSNGFHFHTVLQDYDIFPFHLFFLEVKTGNVKNSESRQHDK